MIGTKLAHFEIKSHLGSGGMGDVYEATDSKLGRSVAIKLLPEAFARDAERVARFEREARVLASLNVPNIAAIYGLERVDARMFLVMEYVPGETLAERIYKARSASPIGRNQKEGIPVDEALEIGKQICEALEAAHEKGIVHRDLKPANIKITPEGKVKVLDFGLAKAYAPQAAAAGANLSHSPTMMTNASMPGIIMGTAAYMSPEQAKGKEVDKRTDIFAFGCLLYEMLSGKRAFDGDDVSDILGSVLKVDPDWSRLPPDVPRDIRKLLRVCLEKNAANRRGTANDVRIDIEQAMKEPAAADAVPPKSGGKIGWLAAIVVLTLALLSVSAIHFSEKSPDAPEMRVAISAGPVSLGGGFALSPDGRSLVFQDNQQRLWLRALDKTDPQPINGTEDAGGPFWSPDSRSIGFFANGKLKRVDIAGGAPRVIADAPLGLGGAWNADGQILFTPNSSSGLYRVSASGGSPTAVTHLSGPSLNSHRYPQFLPDGRHFLFWSGGNPDSDGVYLGSLDGGEPKLLAAGDHFPAFLPPDVVVLMRGGTLMAQHLDIAHGQLIGEPVTIADSVALSDFSFSPFSLSRDGKLAYQSGGVGATQLQWVDRSGKETGEVGEPDPNDVMYPELSPDGLRVAVQRTIETNFDVWILDLLRGGDIKRTRFTFDPVIEGVPVWSPDGQRIAFQSRRRGPSNLYVKAVNGAGDEELLRESPNEDFPQDWSKDGRFLIYWELDSKTGYDLWALPMDVGKEKPADAKPILIANTSYDEHNGQFSPDGKWVAYETNESGRFEIVVQPFPERTGKWQVSTNGGTQPRWRADGKELYFIGPEGKMMAATVGTSASGFSSGTPVELFPTRLARPGIILKQQYAVSRDGRFLLNQQTDASNAPIILILNWKMPK